MTQASRSGSTASRPPRFDERRSELVRCALDTIAELGYARTSLRDIAHNSRFSHGVLHYYFADKAELMTDCLQQYRDDIATASAAVVDTEAASSDKLAGRLAELAGRAVIDEPSTLRLWYDLRAQSAFEASFRPVIAEITAILEGAAATLLQRYAGLAGTSPAVSGEVAYATFDGLFHHFLLQHRGGDAEARPRLEAAVVALVAALAPPG